MKVKLTVACKCPLLVQVRDITTNASWEEAYGLIIPVLTSAQSDGSDEVGACYMWLMLQTASCIVRLLAGCDADLALLLQRKIPRPAPRISADRLDQHIQKALEQHGRDPAEPSS